MGRPNPGGSTMRTRLTEAFGIRHPIVCAPMGLVTGGRLAAAVSAAGGLGIIGGGYAGTPRGEPDLDAELAPGPGQTFGVGLITPAPPPAPRRPDAGPPSGSAQTAWWSAPASGPPPKRSRRAPQPSVGFLPPATTPCGPRPSTRCAACPGPTSFRSASCGTS